MSRQAMKVDGENSNGHRHVWIKPGSEITLNDVNRTVDAKINDLVNQRLNGIIDGRIQHDKTAYKENLPNGLVSPFGPHGFPYGSTEWPIFRGRPFSQDFFTNNVVIRERNQHIRSRYEYMKDWYQTTPEALNWVKKNGFIAIKDFCRLENSVGYYNRHRWRTGAHDEWEHHETIFDVRYWWINRSEFPIFFKFLDRIGYFNVLNKDGSFSAWRDRFVIFQGQEGYNGSLRNLPPADTILYVGDQKY